MPACFCDITIIVCFSLKPYFSRGERSSCWSRPTTGCIFPRSTTCTKRSRGFRNRKGTRKSRSCWTASAWRDWTTPRPRDWAWYPRRSRLNTRCSSCWTRRKKCDTCAGSPGANRWCSVRHSIPCLPSFSVITVFFFKFFIHTRVFVRVLYSCF